MKSKITTLARMILGTVFFLYGLNAIVQMLGIAPGFMPSPSSTPESGALMGAFANSKFMFPLIKVVELVAGLMLITNRFVPLALILIAPVTVIIFFVHLFLHADPIGLSLALLLGACNLFLGFAYIKAFKPLLQAKANI